MMSASSPKTRPVVDAGVVLGILALALLARILAAFVLGNSFHFADEALYVDAAHRMVAGDGFGEAYDRVPAYPDFLAVLEAPLAGNLVLVRCVHAAVVAFGCVLTFLLARRMFGRNAAIVASFLFAPVALVVPPVLPIWIVATSGGAWSRRLLHLVAIWVPVGLSVVPWTVRNYRVHHRMIPIATAGTGAVAARHSRKGTWGS